MYREHVPSKSLELTTELIRLLAKLGNKFSIQFRSAIGITRSDTIYLSGLFNMISAAITPGIQPQIQRIKVINTEPQPLSRTAKGGQIIARRTLQKLIIRFLIDDVTI